MLEEVSCRRGFLVVALGEAANLRGIPSGLFMSAGPRLIALAGGEASVILDPECLEGPSRHGDGLDRHDAGLPLPFGMTIHWLTPHLRVDLERRVPPSAYLQRKLEKRPRWLGHEGDEVPGLDFNQVEIAGECPRARSGTA